MLAGSTVSWSSKKQPTTALSSTEAEYMALTHATTNAIWLRSFLSELHLPQRDSTAIKSDNLSAIALTQNSQFHARTKHIDIQHHFVRERTEANEIEVTFCPTNEMAADILTKALPRPKHEYFTSRLGLTSR